MAGVRSLSGHRGFQFVNTGPRSVHSAGAGALLA